MKFLLKLIYLLSFKLFISSVDGESTNLSESALNDARILNENFDVNKNYSFPNEKTFDDSNDDLNTSDQNDNYVKRADDSNGSYQKKKIDRENSYLKEVHYFHRREFAYENKFHWNSDSNKEIATKKIKKDLYNKSYGKSYDDEDMIEVNKWNDNKNVKNNYNTNVEHIISNYEDKDQKNGINYSPSYYHEKDRDESEEKWFKNLGDEKNTENSYEDNDENNYNNFNSPKFIVNFHKFKPWNRLMKSRDHDNYDESGKNFDEKPVYNSKVESIYDNNYNNEDVSYKERHTETINNIRNAPKVVRYHYERHLLPENYGWIKSERHKSPFDFDDYSVKDQTNRRFVEMPSDWFSNNIHKPSNNIRSAAKIREYRYGF